MVTGPALEPCFVRQAIIFSALFGTGPVEIHWLKEFGSILWTVISTTSLTLNLLFFLPWWSEGTGVAAASYGVAVSSYGVRTWGTPGNPMTRGRARAATSATSPTTTPTTPYTTTTGWGRLGGNLAWAFGSGPGRGPGAHGWSRDVPGGPRGSRAVPDGPGGSPEFARPLRGAQNPKTKISQKNFKHPHFRIIIAPLSPSGGRCCRGPEMA